MRDSKNSDRNALDSPTRTLRQLVPFLSQHKLSIAVVVLLLLLNGAIVIAVGFGASYFIDGLPADLQSAYGFIDEALKWTLLGILLGTVIRFAHGYLLVRISARITESIRCRVFENITDQDVSFFDTQHSGDLQTRIISDINVVGQLVSNQIPINLSSVVKLAGGLAGACIISIPMTLAVTVGLPILFSPFLVVARPIRRISEQVQTAISELGGFSGESFRNVKIVQAYNKKQSEKDNFSRLARKVVDYSVRRALLEKVVSALINALAMFGSVVLLWYCARNIYSGGMTTGELVSFGYFVYLIATAASKLLSSVSALNSALGSAGKIVEYLRLEKHHWPNRGGVQDFEGRIEFKNVYFNYPNRSDTEVLRGVNLTFVAASHVAIVGPSGAGKSTLFELILRFYDVRNGQILLDGRDIIELDVDELRSTFGFVPQKESLVSGSVLENICFGDSGLTLDDAREAAKRVGLDDFILQLPSGYATNLGEVAGRLSGGQKQRISLARAMVRNPRILLLDEANSALDAETDRLIAQSIKSWARGKNAMVLTIAHRLETARLADSILVLSDGNVVGKGSHEFLSKTCKAYQRFLEEDADTKSEQEPAVV